MHRDNLPWLLRHGIHCRSSNRVDPFNISIGDADLIEKRKTRQVLKPPGGTLGDYVPFYFTPFSPMAYNIRTGFRGIRKWRNDEIVMLVSSLHKLSKDSMPFLFTDRHAYLKAALFFTKLSELKFIDWSLLQSRDFKRDNDDLEKLERYQAEALVYKFCPISALVGVACYNGESVKSISKIADGLGAAVKVAAKPDWYFQ